MFAKKSTKSPGSTVIDDYTVHLESQLIQLNFLPEKMEVQELLNWTSTTTSPKDDYTTQAITSPTTLVTLSLRSQLQHDDGNSDTQETTWDHIVGGVIAYLVLVLALIVLVVLQYIKSKPFTLMLNQEEGETYTVSIVLMRVVVVKKTITFITTCQDYLIEK